MLPNRSFAVREGEVVALLGRNGAGKTTTLKTPAAVPHPHSGTIRFAGEQGHIVFKGSADALHASPEVINRYLGL